MPTDDNGNAGGELTPGVPSGFGLSLSSVRVQDFRALRDVAIELRPGTTVLIGENNSGKTSLLEALAVAFGDRRPRLEDLYQSPETRASEFQIDLLVEPTAGEEFAEGVRDVVGDGIRLDREKEYFVIRVQGSIADDGLDISLSRSFLRTWTRSREAAASTEVLKAPPVRRDALGLLRFDMLDARRDIVEQLRNRRTHWGKTTSSLDLSEEIKLDLEDSLKALGEKVTSQSAVLGRVKTDLHDLSEALSHGHLRVDIEALPRNLDDLVRAMDIVITAPQSASFAVANQGMGTRSLAALLVFRSYVNVVRSRLHAERLLSLSAFEEPEAHLHPQSQRAVFRILSEIAGQRVISTHSTHVAAIADVEDFRLFRRTGSEVRVHQVSAARALTFDKERVRRFIQVQNPEVVFARAVGIVEGQTEAAAFPTFARAWWPPRGADGVGVSLVYTEGAGGSKHIIPFLEALSIPWVIFCDGDLAADQGLAATSEAIGRKLDRMSPEVVQLPVGRVWESDLIANGYRPQMVAAAQRHPEGPIDEYARRMHGQLAKGGTRRDYQSLGWEDRAAHDFMTREKGTIGALVAEELVLAGRTDGKPNLPSLVKEFFARLDERLKVAS